MDCGLRVAGTDCGLQDKDGLGGLVPVVSLSLVMLLGAGHLTAFWPAK